MLPHLAQTRPASPSPVAPGPAMPGRTMPGTTWPRRAPPCLAMPRPAPPSLAETHRARPAESRLAERSSVGSDHDPVAERLVRTLDQLVALLRRLAVRTGLADVEILEPGDKAAEPDLAAVAEPVLL